MKASLVVILLALSFPVCANADPLELEGKEWMSWDALHRTIFIAGYLNDVEQVFSRFDMQLRSRPGRNLTAQIVGEALYSRLLREPELRMGPVRDVLFTVVDGLMTLTHRAGAPIPRWQTLMSTSDRAEVLEKHRPQ